MKRSIRLNKPKVLVTRNIFSEDIDRIKEIAEVDLWEEELPPSREILLQKSKGISGILCLITDDIDKELMDNAGTKLKVISQIAVGYNNIDIAEATRRGIPVGYTPDVLTHTTADFAFALLMATARLIVPGYNAVSNGLWKTWHPLHFLGQDVYGSTLGIVGMGRIGFEMARRSIGFNMNVIYYDINRRRDLEDEVRMKYVSFDELLAISDFVSIHVDLNPVTKNMFNEEQFNKMKESSVIINAARGPIIDNMALYSALKDNKIYAAGLDVTDPEPIPSNHPLLTLDNCLIVPHIASASVATRKAMSRLATTNLINGLMDRSLSTCVNQEING